MSAGQFVLSKYEASYAAQIHPIKIQPESKDWVVDKAPASDITNSEPGANVNNPISAQTSLTRRTKGLRPRFVTVKWIADKPTGYTGAGAKLVVLTKAAFDGVSVGDLLIYLGKQARITAKEPERAT